MSEIHDRPTDPIDVFRYEVILQKNVVVYAATEQEARARLRVAQSLISNMAVISVTQILPKPNGHPPTGDIESVPPPSPSAT